MKVLGIDESGRGACLGPLVVCGMVFDQSQERKLKKMKVKDSKMLSAKDRERLAPEIEKLATHTVVIRIPSCRIDGYRRKGTNLNQIEALKMADIINLVQPDKVIVDAPSYNTNKFHDFLWSKIENKNVELVCENFADKNYPFVSAASIVGKVERDKAVRELEKKIGEPIGFGYPSDKTTISFIEKLAENNNGRMPTYVRQTWDTVLQITKKYKQRRIINFFRGLVGKDKRQSKITRNPQKNV